MSLTLGVLGASPAATLDFLAKLQVFTPATADHDHIRVLLDLDPGLPARAPSASLVASNLAEMAGALHGGGAEALALVSNSAHGAGDLIQRACGVPLVDMIGAAASAARATGARRVGVLGSRGSLRLYREYLAAQAMGMVALPAEPQEVFLAVLGRLRAGEVGAVMRQHLADFATELMAEGAEVVIVGAVEAALVMDPEDFRVDLIDPTEQLARRCVAVCLGFDPLPALPG